MPAGSRTAETSPSTGGSPARADSDAVLALTERLAELERGRGLSPTRELIEVGPLLLTLEEEQLPEVLAMLESLRAPPPVKASLISTLFLRWTELDPVAAIQRAEAIADPQTRSTASQAVLSAWAEQDPRAAWDHVMNQDAGIDQLQLFVAIATRDPGGAATLTQQIENPAIRNRAYASLASLWASLDPGAAFDWANALDDDAARRQILPIILGTMAREDPGSALDLALAEVDASIRQPAVSRILARAVRSDPDAGLALLDRLPEDFPFERFASVLGGSLAAADPEQVSAYLGRLPQGNAQAKLLKTIVQLKINHGASEEALPFLDLVPEGPGRADVYHTFARGWGRDDPLGTSEWLEELPSGRERDRAIQGYSWSRLESDPEAALIWASSIGEPQLRDSQIRSLAREWLRRDRDAAIAWIGSSDLVSSYLQEPLLPRSGN